MSYFVKIGALVKDIVTPKRLYMPNIFGSSYQKRVLVSYITAPFMLEKRVGHSSWIESIKIAEIFDGLSYQVDIIRYDGNFSLINFGGKQYDLIFGLEPNFLRAINKLHYKKSIYYATGAYWKFQNQAESSRIKDLKKRRGVLVREVRRIAKNNAPEVTNSIISIGNNWTKSTYVGCAEKIETIRISAHSFFPYNQIADDKDWGSAKKKFLWFGSVGAVHKGLDLLLEIFPNHSDIELFICGSIEKEKDFIKLYHKELFETPNIHFIGWISPDSEKFSEIIKKCAFTVLPSCSEGMSGSTATCMHSGLIPLISRECGIDTNSGITFRDNKIETIEKDVLNVSSKSDRWVKIEAEKAYEVAKDNFNIDNFEMDFKRALGKILQNKKH